MQRDGNDSSSGRDRKEYLARQGNMSRVSERATRTERVQVSMVLNGPGSVTLQSFGGPFTIGRSRRSDFVIPTSDDTRTVSKIHARVFPMPEDTTSTSTSTSTAAAASASTSATRPQRHKWIVQDLNTLNGTAINGMDLMPGGSFELHDGDEIVLSSTVRNGVRLSVQIPEGNQARIYVKYLVGGVTSGPAWRGTHSRAAPASLAQPSPSQLRPVSVSAAAPTSTPVPPPVAAPAQVTVPQSSLTKRPRSAEERARSDGKERTLDSKRSCVRRVEEESDGNDKERFMVCPVCLDYFHNSATLSCSHTFCGHCISHWFRTSASLSCPECRANVAHLPVRNRALDELVQKLAGESDAFRAAVQKQANAERESAVAAQTEAHGLGFDLRTHPSIFRQWTAEEKLVFSEFIIKQFGERRVTACRQIGLSEAAIDGASATELLLVARNLLIDFVNLRAFHEANNRIKIYLHYG